MAIQRKDFVLCCRASPLAIIPAPEEAGSHLQKQGETSVRALLKLARFLPSGGEEGGNVMKERKVIGWLHFFPAQAGFPPLAEMFISQHLSLGKVGFEDEKDPIC